MSARNQDRAPETHKKNGNLAVIFIAIVILLGVFVFSGYQLLSYYSTGIEAEDDFEVLLPDGRDTERHADYTDIKSTYDVLYEQNEDFVGWLRIDDTKINYPVMQAKNAPEFYLRRDFAKQYSAAGVPFVSDASDVERPSDLILIYGHAMKNGTMFGQLSKLRKADFLAEHDVIFFDTLTERREYKIFSVIRTDVDTGEENEFRYYNMIDFADEKTFRSYLADIRARQLVGSLEDPVMGDELIALSTCEGVSGSTSRLVVFGYRIV